jgi:hypothetical protein
MSLALPAAGAPKAMAPPSLPPATSSDGAGGSAPLLVNVTPGPYDKIIRLKRGDWIVHGQQLLGSGTFAKVYRGRDLRTGASVAVKSINRTKLGSAKLQDQLKKEIALMRELQHPNIVRLIDVYVRRCAHDC